MTGRRKRMRSPSDCDECVPISKRINSLHIRPSIDDEEATADRYVNNNSEKCHDQECSTSWQSPSNQFGASTSSAVSSCQHNDPTAHQEHHYLGQLMTPLSGQSNGCFHPDVVNNGNCNNDFKANESSDLMNYDPDLDVRENPHYFQINHVLFNAHSFRMQRLKHKFEDGS